MPTPEEIKECTAFAGDLKFLSRPDHFVRAIGHVPRLQPRVEAMQIMVDFAEKQLDTQGPLETVLSTLNKLKANTKIRQIIEVATGGGGDDDDDAAADADADGGGSCSWWWSGSGY